MNLYILTLHKNGYIKYVSFVSDFFHLAYFFIIHPCCRMCWIVFYFMDRSHFSNPFNGWWILGLFTLWDIIRVQFLVWTCVFNSLGYITKSRIAGSDRNMLNFFRNIQIIFQSGYTISNSYQHCMRVLISYIFAKTHAAFLLLPILADVKSYFTVKWFVLL